MDGKGRMGWEMLDGRMIEKIGGGSGGEREYIVRSHGRHYGKRRICFFRVEIQVENRRREMIDSFVAGSFMSCFSDNTGGSFVRW